MSTLGLNLKNVDKELFITVYQNHSTIVWYYVKKRSKMNSIYWYVTFISILRTKKEPFFPYGV